MKFTKFFNWTSGIVIALVTFFGMNMTATNRMKTTLMAIIKWFMIVVNAYCFLTWTWFAVCVLHSSARMLGVIFILNVIGIWVEVLMSAITCLLLVSNGANIRGFLQITCKYLYNSLATFQMEQVTTSIRWPTLAITVICLLSNAAYGGYLVYALCFDSKVAKKFTLLSSSVYGKVPENGSLVFIMQAVNIGLYSGLQRFFLTSTLVLYAHTCLVMKALLKIPELVYLQKRRSWIKLEDKVMAFLEKHELACDTLKNFDFMWSKIAFCWVGLYTFTICLEIKVMCVKMELITVLHLVVVALHFVCFMFCAASATTQVYTSLQCLHNLPLRIGEIENLEIKRNVFNRLKVHLAKLVASPIGWSGWRTFLLNRSTVLTIVGTIATYSVLLSEVGK